MHKKGLCVKKWTKIGSNIGTKIMFFPITRRTLLKKPEKFLAKVASTKPRN
jgi:hypothetical protein